VKPSFNKGGVDHFPPATRRKKLKVISIKKKSFLRRREGEGARAYGTKKNKRGVSIEDSGFFSIMPGVKMSA